MELLKHLKHDKIKINWNKNPIRMDLFVSFLTVDTNISHDHLGSYNGWTKRYNHDHKLEIGGGIVNGINYLDTIQYGIKLSNPYNNYVNPFYIFDIMTEDGRKFFLNYYKDDIAMVLLEQEHKVDYAKTNLEKQINNLETLRHQLYNLTNKK